MKKISNKVLEQALKDFSEIDNLAYVKDKCLTTIFKTEMSIKQYAKFITKTFEFDVSVSTVKEWKKEFDELQLQNKPQAPTQNENEISHGYPDKSIEQ
jgi:hypothetical protein